MLCLNEKTIIVGLKDYAAIIIFEWVVDSYKRVYKTKVKASGNKACHYSVNKLVKYKEVPNQIFAAIKKEVLRVNLDTTKK